MSIAQGSMKFKFIPRLPAEVAVSLLIVPIVALMILPVPVLLLDTLLAVNLTVAVMLLMATLFSSGALSLSTFPALLLFTTMFRLGLNIASTKSILLHADAGHLITTFGELVVGGNLVVGIVVFAIITIVQFIVITKGSERVAEVGARFTLDAMPGKQMAIDADMRAGHLTAEQARSKREELSSESKLHGGMDGAMKFVKGDAIAGLVITLINLLGGIVVGVMYHGMTAGEAANVFAVLSIGDAMVSSIPSLFISLAAGVLITRVDLGGQRSGQTLGKQVIAQLTASRTALWCASGMVGSLALIPGFPWWQFALLAGALAYLAYQAPKGRATPHSDDAPSYLSGTASASSSESSAFAQQPPASSSGLGVRLSASLARQLDASALDEKLTSLAPRLQQELGMPFPSLAVWCDEQWPEHGFELLMQDVPSLSIAVPKDSAWTLAPEGHERCLQVDSPSALGWTVYWHPQGTRSEDVRLSPIEALIQEATYALVLRNAGKFVGLQEAVRLFESISKDYAGLVDEAKKLIPMQRIAEVLRRLLEEGVPIRNVRNILESLISWGPREKDVVLLTEYVRQGLGPWLAHHASGGSGVLPAVMLDVAVEQIFRQNLKPTPAGSYVALSSDIRDWFESKVTEVLAQQEGREVSLVVSMDIRKPVRKLVESKWPSLKVYSYQELEGHAQLASQGLIAMES